MFQRSVALFCLAAIAFSLAGCVAPPPAASPRPAALGQPFTLRLGERARLPDARLDITFDAVLADGRCPSAAQCVNATPVRVGLKVQRIEGAASSVLQLSAHTGSDGRVLAEPRPDALPADRYGAALIALLSVTPYPGATPAASPGDYAVTLLVTALTPPISPTAAAPPTAAMTASPTAAMTTKPTAAATPTTAMTARPTMMLPATPTVVSRPALGAAFELAYGQTVALDEIGMKITFREVARDSRCPADVNCVWSGIVDVRIEAALPPQPAQQLLLGGATTAQGVVLGPVVGASGPAAAWYAGYTISLKRVTPYPAHANRPDPHEAYAITLVVTLAPARDVTPTPAVKPTPTFPADPTGLPLLCVSERVLTQRMAGVKTTSPARLTPPVAAAVLLDKATLTALCQAQFGNDFHAVDVLDSLAMWKEFLPAGAAFWRWDHRAGRPIMATP